MDRFPLSPNASRLMAACDIIFNEQNFDRSIGAATVPRTEAEQHWPVADVEASLVKRSSEKVANGRGLQNPSLAARADKYPAGRGASSPAPIIELRFGQQVPVFSRDVPFDSRAPGKEAA